jgi:hypothetical protein
MPTANLVIPQVHPTLLLLAESVVVLGGHRCHPVPLIAVAQGLVITEIIFTGPSSPEGNRGD